MVDDDLKKILSDLKMDDLVKELEDTPKKPRFTLRHILISSVAIVSLGLCTFAFMYRPTAEPQPQTELIAEADHSDDEEETASDDYDYENPYKDREEAAASWAKKMVEIEPDMGHDVHELWDLLRQRKDDLEDTASELSNLLFDNARRRQDFISKEVQVFLSRYQAVDTRHSVKIANSINAIYALIQKKHDPDLNQAYAEMLGELGAEMYSTHQLQISKEILLQEMRYNRALQTVREATSLKELHAGQLTAKVRLKEIESNGVMQTFSQVDFYEKQLIPCVKEGLNNLFFLAPKDEMFDPQDSALLEALLQTIKADESEQKKYFEQFQRYMKQEEGRSTIHPQSSVAFN